MCKSIQQPFSFYKTITTIHSIQDVKKLFPDSFGKIGHVQSEYTITYDPSVSPVQHRRHRFPIEAKKEIKA